MTLAVLDSRDTQMNLNSRKNFVNGSQMDIGEIKRDLAKHSTCHGKGSQVSWQ
jgi:hypothetical protein